MNKIEIGHGSGGRLTRDLIEHMFLQHMSSEALKPLEDAASLRMNNANIAMTTDSYVIRPLFFPGGNIGRLSVCGTVNDLIVSGALPRYISAGFIIEEGFSADDLERIVISISSSAEASGVKIVTGDTKVVERGNCDGIYVNTTGIGEIVRSLSLDNITEGDVVIISGTIGDHGTAVAIARNEFDIDTQIESDCASLNTLLIPLLELEGLKWMRDPTRGGVATVLSELSEHTGLGVKIFEENLPVRDDVRFISDMLGYDPLYLANEGKAVIVASHAEAENVLEILRKDPLGAQAAVIGKITDAFRGVRLITVIGGERVIDMLEEDMLPRIC